ncbi:MAG: NAD(P)H-dependent oxidoreductase subunit E [Deltaproteobacteria bacterium]|nr:NAD(P)H-dependent oxidoreductase subunit E [Deltaproteobacteria bacterium]
MVLEFTPEAQARIREIVLRYPTREAALIPVLYLAQDEFGSLSTEAMELVARQLELPLARVLGTATFYTMLRKQPVGRFHLEVCRNVSCYLRGSDGLLETLTRVLGIAPGETTGDGLFTLDTVECLAACGSGPALQVNGEFHENMTPAALEQLIARLREDGTA